MRQILFILTMISVLGVTGCASKLMQPVDPASVNSSIPDNESAIVFFRATNIGGAIQAPVIEVLKNGKLGYVAIIAAGTKYLHQTTPGKHFFVVGGESSDMLEADLEAGKTYYAYVSPRIGLFKARFVFIPVADVKDETFKKDLAWCKWVQNTLDGNQWFESNLPSLQKKYAAARKNHQEVKPDEKKIILPEYGSPVVLQ